MGLLTSCPVLSEPKRRQEVDSRRSRNARWRADLLAERKRGISVMSNKSAGPPIAPAPTSHFQVEQRRHLRRRILAPAFLDNAPEGKAVIVDISRSGLGLLVLPGMDVTHLQLRFRLPGTEVLARVTGEVRWRDHTGRCGIEVVAVDCKPADWHGWFEKLKTPARVLIETSTDAQAPEPDGATSQSITSLRDNLTLTVRPESATRSWRWIALGILMIAVLAGIILKGRDVVAAFLSFQRSHLSLALQDRPAVTPKSNRESVQTEIMVVQGTPMPAKRASSEQAPARITEARIVHRTDPEFPEVALKAGVGGEVKALLTITEKGSVEKVEILQGDYRLGNEVYSALAHWRYLPFKVDGRPVAVKLPITVTFVLRQRVRSSGHEQRH